MNKNVQFFIIFCMMSFSLQSSEESLDHPSRSFDRPLTLAESSLAGGLTGAGEVFFPGHILTTWMNRTIAKEPMVWNKVHKGGLTNLVAQFPITAVANTVNFKGSQLLENSQQSPLTQGQVVGMSLVSGVAAGVVDTISNAVQLRQQKPEHMHENAIQALKKLRGKSLRGMTATGFKEAKFALAWQVAATKGEEFASKYINNPNIAKAVGGAGVGVATAVVTHPWAVIRNKMQGDIDATMYKTTLQTAQKIYEQEAVAGLMKGLPQRGVRVAIAIPLYSVYSKKLETFIKENR